MHNGSFMSEDKTAKGSNMLSSISNECLFYTHWNRYTVCFRSLILGNNNV